MDLSARLGLAYLASGQLQKHIALNESLSRLDLLVQTRILSRRRVDQPSDPADGDVYVLPEGASGPAWSGFAPGDLTRFDFSGWVVEAIPEGLIAVVADEGLAVTFGDGEWRPLSGRVETVRIDADTDWSPPGWARRIEATAMGAGGGGGAGQAGDAGASRFGGGGGAAGEAAVASWPVEALTGPLEIRIGAYGVGGTASAPEGGDGGATSVRLGGLPLLTARGGMGGGGGSTASGEGGASDTGNGGGSSRIEGAGLSGEDRRRTDLSGGGGAGGALTITDQVWTGGDGGVGGRGRRPVAGGSGGEGAVGANGSAPVDIVFGWAGSGGGGGGASLTMGHAGGSGGPGAGGGGGGAGRTGRGVGGHGGAGLVLLTAAG